MTRCSWENIGPTGWKMCASKFIRCEERTEGNNAWKSHTLTDWQDPSSDIKHLPYGIDGNKWRWLVKDGLVTQNKGKPTKAASQNDLASWWFFLRLCLGATSADCGSWYFGGVLVKQRSLIEVDRTAVWGWRDGIVGTKEEEIKFVVVGSKCGSTFVFLCGYDAVLNASGCWLLVCFRFLVLFECSLFLWWWIFSSYSPLLRGDSTHHERQRTAAYQ